MSDEDFGPEFWLHVASDALRHYVEDGGALVVLETDGGITVTLVGVFQDSPDLKQEFADLILVPAGGQKNDTNNPYLDNRRFDSHGLHDDCCQSQAPPRD